MSKTSTTPAKVQRAINILTSSGYEVTSYEVKEYDNFTSHYVQAESLKGGNGLCDEWATAHLFTKKYGERSTTRLHDVRMYGITGPDVNPSTWAKFDIWASIRGRK